MSDDLTLYTSNTGLDFFASMVTDEDAEDEFADVPLSQLIPRVKLSKESGQFIIKMADTVMEGEGGKTLEFAIIAVMGRRALFAPDEFEDYRAPICSTGWQRPVDFRKENVNGNWQVNDDFQPPYDDEDYAEAENGQRVGYSCRNCRWNQYDTAKEWSGGTSKGKACGEGRTYFIVPVIRRGNLADAIRAANPEARVDAIDPSIGLYEFDTRWSDGAANPGIALMDLTMGSNSKAIKDIPLMRKAANQGRKMPLFATVFKATVEVEKITNSISLARLRPQVAGQMHPADVKGIYDNLYPFVKDFAMENAHKASESKDVDAF